MKFGVMHLFPADGSDRDVLLQTVDDIALADELGFDSAWLAEHHFSRYGLLGNPLMLSALLAERTDRIILGTAVLVLPFHDPVRLAEDAALLDNLSGGRLRLGIGRGYQPKEFAGFRRNAADNKELYQETVDILKLAWGEGRWSYEGKHYQLNDMEIFPRPYTPGGPPLVHGTSSRESFRMRGLRGEAIIVSPQFTPLSLMQKNLDSYKTALIEGGFDPLRYDMPYMQQVWTGASTDQLRAASEAALKYYKSVGQVIPGSEEAVEAEKKYYEAVRRNIDLLDLENTLTHGGNFGSTDQVVDAIGRLHEQLGINHYIGWFRIPALDPKVARESMERFATEVIPQVKHLGAVAPSQPAAV
jgi:alkanesulfonate monooxygenase SsuD/methylene tetrahydromethanopterin reductase-like flavin-dependent oxidoreductase (luciferase family)